MPKKKPKKLTPQQVEQLEVQGIQQMLEAQASSLEKSFQSEMVRFMDEAGKPGGE